MSGRDLITAIAVGQDLFHRLIPHVGRRKDWNFSTVTGVYCATAACAKLLGLPSGQVAAAFGIASMQSCGTMAVVYATGSDLRALCAAFPTHGAVTAALLANLYMRRFVLGWQKLGLAERLGTRIVTCADDLVILCKRGKAEEALTRMRDLMGRLKLTVNEQKTRICKVPDGQFDFLGYTFGRMNSPTTGKACLGMRPSKKSIRRMVETLHAMTSTSLTWQATTQVVGKLNRTLRG